MHVSLTIDEIIETVQPKSIRGSTTEQVRGIAALNTAEVGDLSFLGRAKFRAEVATSRSSVILLPVDYAGEPIANQLFLLVENPSLALARVCGRIEQLLWPRPAPGIHPLASVAVGATIAASATIGPMCVIEAGAVVGERSHLQAQVFLGREARVGDDCWLMPGAIVQAECIVEHRVRLHAGVVIGSDGFGYEFLGGRHEKIPQIGTVLVESDVEIGANSTIDRARFSRTVIGAGTKIDNLVQIGHNVIIGQHCILCAQVGISGSTTLGDFVVMGGQAGAAGHVTIGKGVKAGGRAGLNADVAPGLFVNGNPAIPYMLERRLAVLQHRLPSLFKRVEALEEQLEKSSS
jgi:UDP-3-O-[3-hydroxymyristoyl] glucosamine N-acyltransferase